MQNLLTIWSSLDITRKILAVAATVGVFVGILALTSQASKPNMTLLYAGLENKAAGQVITALDQQGAKYSVRGSSIFVEETRRDQLRMALAAEGLPANGIAGYELLDGLSGFGTTSQMFDAAYWRAKEGELARTILASRGIKSVRVHLSKTATSPFQRNQSTSASVTVSSSGGTLSAAQANAFRYLISSAVAGLDPDGVAVIDGDTGRVVGETSNDLMDQEKTSAALQKKVQRLIEARVGAGNVVVEVSVERVTESESITERTIDPDTRVAISTDTEERTSEASNPAGGAVTVASNLPDGDGAAGGNGTSQDNTTRERTNYEISETKRELLRVPGAIKRLSVAVLVDGVTTNDGNGGITWSPRTAEELATLRDLVSSAVGLSEERGDSLTLESLQFETLETLGSTAPASSTFDMGAIDLGSLLKVGILALVSLILGLFVIRPILTAPKNQALALPNRDQDWRADAAAAVSEAEAAASDGASASAISPPVANATQLALPAGVTALTANEAIEMPDDPSSLAQTPKQTQEAAAERLKELLEERREEAIEVLQRWIEPVKEGA